MQCVFFSTRFLSNFICLLQHIYESEQLLNSCAEADKKRKEERKRQLDMINQRREARRMLSRSEQPAKRKSFAGGAKPS